jgi:ABC-type transport system involved in multi-copper enzyme maturation permease subunit
MMLARVLPVQVAKEVRALLPAWAACAAAVAAAGTIGDRRGIFSLGILIYCAGSLGLGAMSIGHEYSGRTMQLMLSQPRSRARVFIVKQGVLLAMLLTLGAVAWTTLNNPQALTLTALMVTVTLSVLGGLSVSPLVTMMSRNPLAGMVFTLVVPGMVWLPIDWLAPGATKLAVFWRAMVALCAIAAVLGWRTFMRLEAKEGRGPHVHIEWSSAGSVAAPDRWQHPVWRLVSKELRLQQLTLVVCAIYVLGSLKLLGHVSDAMADVHAGLTVLYSGTLALLIGSLASAEEREYGTLESQLLLPMASSTQWAVKVGVALGLALLLGVGFPALMIASLGRAIRIDEWYAGGILILTVTGLYISSLSSTGIRALLTSFLATPVVILIGAQFSFGSGHPTMSQAVMLASFLILVLWFAFENHRSAERLAWGIGRQVFVMTGCLALAGVLLAVL